MPRIVGAEVKDHHETKDAGSSPANGGPPPRYITVSEIYDFLRDEWRWYAKWVLNRVPKKRIQALELGSAVHKIFEAHFGHNIPLEDAFNQEFIRLAGEQRNGDEMAGEVALELVKYKTQIVGFQDTIQVKETLEVEQPFEVELGTWMGRRWILRGRPDRVIYGGGAVWHMQNRTLDRSKNVMVYARLLQRNMHETLYGRYLMEKYKHVGPYGGTMVNIIRKLGTKQRGTDEPRDVRVLGFQCPVAISDKEMARAWRRLHLIIDEMSRKEAVGAHDTTNLIDCPLLDGGPFGNSPDAYFEVLSGATTLEDDTLFETRKDTYADVGRSES